jgi:hypothetical protein
MPMTATSAETFPMVYGRKYHTITVDQLTTEWDRSAISYCGRYGNWDHAWTDEAFISDEHPRPKSSRNSDAPSPDERGIS